MKRLLVLLAVFMITLVSSSGAAAFPKLHIGSHGKKVRDAQWLMRGHNRYGVFTFHHRITGRYGPVTATATKQAKYRLGYAKQDNRFGPHLYLILVGKQKLTPSMRAARHRRQAQRRHTTVGRVFLSGACRTRPPHSYVIEFTRRVSAEYGHPVVCVSGRRYSYVLGTGHLSMHVYGAAADLSTPTVSQNLLLGQAALRAAGMSALRARLTFSPVSYGYWYGGVNILFHTFVGGNHWNHVHVGLWHLPRRRTLASATTTPKPPLTGEAVMVTPGVGAWHTRYYYGMPVPNARTLAGVLAVKQGLIANGYGRGIDTMVRSFGWSARARTKDFQAARGLPVDGVVGPATALVLFRLYARREQTTLGVPSDLVCKQKTLESANDPVAQGVIDPGDEGIAQIHLDFHPGVTKAEAWSPAFAIDWEAHKIADYHSRIGDWEGAVGAWNSGEYYATKWVRAGKPASGLVLDSGVDVYKRLRHYVDLVKTSRC